MRKTTPEGTYQIQYATARVEAIMALAEAAMMVLLDGPDGRNAHVARAVKMILDDQTGPLKHRLKLLDEAVEQHDPDPDHYQVPESQPKFAERLQEITERYEQHTGRFPRNMKHTPDSVFYTWSILPLVINRALNHLNAEVMTRETQDPTRRGYRDAMLELASIITVKDQRKVLDISQKRGDPNSDRKKRFMKQAWAAVQDSERPVRRVGPCIMVKPK